MVILTEGSSVKKHHNECLKEEVKKNCLYAFFLTTSLKLESPDSMLQVIWHKVTFGLTCPHLTPPNKRQSANERDSTGRGLLIVVWGRKNQRPVF